MKIHEYQGKELLRQFNVPVPNGIPAFSLDEAVKAAEKLGGPVWVVRAKLGAVGILERKITRFDFRAKIWSPNTN
jgi:succinyl-CoA synthetase beta subunit